MRALLVFLLLVPLQDRPGKVATGAAGMVAAEHRDGVDVGVEILEKGGNAVDAAVASAFAMGVALPSHSGLGGRSQFLIRLKGGRAFHIDGGNQVPKAWKEGEGGKLSSVCIPGSPAALEMALKEGGTMALKDAMAPAIRLAKSKKQAELVATLEAIADGGAKAFYTGRIAEAIEADMLERGGFVRKDDLAEYKAVLKEAVTGTYRGFGVLTTDRPASGLVVLEALNILETFDFTKVAGEADRDHLVIESLRLAFEDRGRKWEKADDRLPTLASKDHAKKRAAEIDLKKAGEPRLDGDEEGDTTHLTVVDRDGNACSFTQSLGAWYGAGKAAKLGFFYNETHGLARSPKPGQRLTSGQSPTMLVKDDRAFLVIGSAGESRIMSAVLETIHRVVDRGQSLRDAIYAPRFHWQGPKLMFETRVEAKELEVPKKIREELEGRGFPVSAMPSSFYFGRVQAALWDGAKKEWVGVADPRATTGAAKAPAK